MASLRGVATAMLTVHDGWQHGSRANAQAALATMTARREVRPGLAPVAQGLAPLGRKRSVLWLDRICTELTPKP